MNPTQHEWSEEQFNDIFRKVAASSTQQSVIPETTSVVQAPAASVLNKRIFWVAGGTLAAIALAALIGGGMAIAAKLQRPQAAKNQPVENVASKNVEVAPTPIPTDEQLQSVIKPNPAPTPAALQPVTGNATVVVPDGYDSLAVRNSDGLGIGYLSEGDRVEVIKDDGGDRVVVRSGSLTGSVVRSGLRHDSF